MSNIPSSAVHTVLAPAQRVNNEQLRARKVQADKASHHMEDVEELDDTAVNSVDERKQGGGNQRDKGKRKEEPEEKVEIANLDAKAVITAAKAGKPRQLDISA